MRRSFSYFLVATLSLTAATAAALLFTAQGQSIITRVEEKHRTGELEQTVHQILSGLIARVSGDNTVDDMSIDPSREDLPEFVTIGAIPIDQLTPAMGGDAALDVGRSWTHSFGDAGSTKFSNIEWLTPEGVQRLEYAWTYETLEATANIQATPVFTGRYLVFPDALDRIVAVEPQTGETAWHFDPGISAPARRGLVFVPEQDAAEGHGVIYFAAAGRVFAIDAQTGEPDHDFGVSGSVNVGFSVRVAPQVSGDLLYVASFMPAVHAINRHTGERVWTANLLTGDLTSSFVGRVLQGRADFDGANPWGGMSLDYERGLLFLALSNPVPVAYGATRVGDNAPANSVIALDASTGEQVWQFQEIMHDLWDLDIAAPPVLGSIERNGTLYDVVAVATKAGNLIVLDRLSGRPVYDWRLRRAPTSIVPGERTAAYQPDPVLPEPFGQMAFALTDVTDIGQTNRDSVLEQLKEARFGFYPPHEPGQQTVFYGLHGGAMQMGAALDTRNGLLFVASSHVPSSFSLVESGSRQQPAVKEIEGDGASVYRAYCAACHGDRLEGALGPSLAAVDPAFSRGRFYSILKDGLRAMPALPQLSDDDSDALYRMIVLGEGVERAAGPEPESAPATGEYRRTAYQRLNDHEGYPGSRPPWGTLTAIDLSTGKHVWRVPLGRHDELMARGIPQTGTVNLSGPVVTAGGVVFAAGTTDRLLRAFDATTGAEIWEAQLPFVGSASPMIFEYGNAAYVVIPATGGGTLSYYDPSIETGSAFVAYRVSR
ncbi:PQQ-binding-like beta-propeller repeat protein [Sulfitobacter pontiacus]|uniref:outer membrane protein assembly factor BamB family protein n=1 Tax=Sulfitobacter pontiacus TaxID=60137 RepID=UPI0030EC3F12